MHRARNNNGLIGWVWEAKLKMQALPNALDSTTDGRQCDPKSAQSRTFTIDSMWMTALIRSAKRDAR